MLSDVNWVDVVWLPQTPFLRSFRVDRPGLDRFDQHKRFSRDLCTARVSVARKPASSTSVFSARRAELGRLERDTIVVRSLTVRILVFPESVAC